MARGLFLNMNLQLQEACCQHWGEQPGGGASLGGGRHACLSELILRHVPVLPQDAVTVLLARTTAQLQAVERELAEERVKLEYTEEMERKEEQTEARSER